jgi:hypothetical protein
MTYQRRIRKEVPIVLTTQEPPKELLSTNRKTKYSVNLSIAGVCQPSAVCARVCYACNGQIAMDPSMLKAARLTKYFRETDTAVAAERLYRECHRKKLKHLRWHGSGDLIPETVAIINYLAGKYDLVHVVFTRIPELINLLDDNPDRIVINVSLDSASLDLPERITHPHVRYTYLRETLEDLPPTWTPAVPIEVVFPVHTQRAHLDAHDPRDCPVDGNRMALDGACDKCLRCYRNVAATFNVYNRKHSRSGGSTSPSSRGNPGRSCA